MQSSTNLLVVVGFVFLASVCPAQEAGSGAIDSTVGNPEKPEVVSFPYVAEIDGTDVYIRSGHGTAYYFCIKLSEPERVTVVGHKYGWSKILPPAGSFSWISKQYVKPDPANPSIGIVTGDSVRVYAGSPHREPMRSNMQTKLNEGDHVDLIGPGKGDYYKIAPPPGAYLWVSSQYVKYIGPISKPKPPVLPPKPEPMPVPEPAPEQPSPETVVDIPRQAAPTSPPAAVVKPPALPVNTTKLAEYQKLVDQIEVELEKPIDKQVYKAIKDSLKAIADDPKAGKIKHYANYQIERIERFELARQIGLEVKSQDNKLASTREQIKNKHAETIANLPDTGMFIVTGKLKQSQIYTPQTGQKRYMIVDEAGKILCYAVPADSAVNIDLDMFLHRRVGLAGEVIADPYSPVGLVRFTEVAQLKPVQAEE